MKPMIIDISKINEFKSSDIHIMILNRKKLILIGSNPRLETTLKILGFDKILHHEKDPEVVNSILTEV